MKGYITNSAWMLIEKLIKLAINFVFIGLVAKKVGPSDFGFLTFSQSLVVLLLSIAGLGLDNLLINEFIKNKDQSRNIFSTVFWSRVLVSIVFLIICMSYFYFCGSYQSDEVMVVFFTISSLVFYAQNTYVSYYQSLSDFKFITRIYLMCYLILSVVKVYLLYVTSSIVVFSFILMVDMGLTFIMIIYATRNNDEISISLIMFDLSIIKSLLKKSWPLIFSSLLVVLYTRLDHFMISKMLGINELGLFSVAVRISDAYVFIPSLIVTSFYPMICRDKGIDNVKFYFDLVFLSAFLCGIIIFLLSPFVIPFLFGDEYKASISVVQITIFSSMFSVFGGAVTNYFLLINLSYIRLIRACVGLLINFILNLYLIPIKGIEGAAFASLFSQIFAVWISNLITKSTRECFFMQTRTIMTVGCACLIKLKDKRVPII